jgi:hypothetical protein
MANNNKLFIPEKLCIGRRETTPSLVYVTYYDAKNVLRKKVSFDNWRDKKIPLLEPKNKPFKKLYIGNSVGGVKHSWSSNARQEYVRVTHPDGHTFELTLPNFLFLLTNSSSKEGVIEGNFVFAWGGTELLVLPTSTPEYKDCLTFTQDQGKKISARELVKGYTYKTKKGDFYIYLGYFENIPFYKDYDFKSIKKYHYFATVRENEKKVERITKINSASELAYCSEAKVSKLIKDAEKKLAEFSDTSRISSIVLHPHSQGRDHTYSHNNNLINPHVFFEENGKIYTYSHGFEKIADGSYNTNRGYYSYEDKSHRIKFEVLIDQGALTFKEVGRHKKDLIYDGWRQKFNSELFDDVLDKNKMMLECKLNNNQSCFIANVDECTGYGRFRGNGIRLYVRSINKSNFVIE